LLDLAPCDFVVSQIKNETEEMMFWNSIWHPKGFASGTQQHWGKWLPWCSWLKHRKNEGISVYVPRLFWKGWQTKLSKLSQHFFVDLIREHSNAPHIVFAQGNPYTEHCVKHSTASCQYHPGHWRHHKHSTQHVLLSEGQVWKIYSKFGDIAPPPNTS
jgi:hypothetical protein